PPGTPPRDAVTVTQNTDFGTYLKAVNDARNVRDPRVTALRVFRPEQPLEFSSDARGFLVALVHDLQLEVPAPDEKAAAGLIGAPAKVLRIKVPLAEIALSYQIDPSSSDALRLRGKIEEFNPGTNSEVLAINGDENQANPLTRIAKAFVMGAIGAKVRGQSIDV